jgi:TrmH family RNA methyltransferase
MRKELIELLKDKQKMKEQGLFVIDTEKTLEEALKYGLSLRHFLYAEESKEMLARFPAAQETAEKVRPGYIDRFASVKSHRGFIAVVEKPENTDIDIKGAGAIVLLDGVQDPSNLGAIIRSGAAFGFQNYLLLNECANIYSDKVIRASAGSVFAVKFRQVEMKEVREIKKDFNVLVSDVENGVDIKDASGRAGNSFILALGSEGRGVSAELKNIADMNIKISYTGKVESLNVASAAAVIFYEFSRHNEK